MLYDSIYIAFLKCQPFRNEEKIAKGVGQEGLKKAVSGVFRMEMLESPLCLCPCPEDDNIL